MCKKGLLIALILLWGIFINQWVIEAEEKVDKGLCAYWSFDEGKGQIAFDKSKNANHAVIHGARWVKGKFGSALYFDGIDDYVDCGNDQSLNSPEKEITISLWFKPSITYDDAFKGELLCKNYYLYFHRGHILFSYFCGGKDFAYLRTTQNEWEEGKWYHIVAVYDYDLAEMKIYINGVLDNCGDHPRAIVGSPHKHLTIGIGDTKSYFKGTIDEVRIYNRVLSMEEIKSLYEKNKIE
ncbi:LamG domain-containing protein [Candidatus Calescamantes bacterium]|nr:LamG domain-containing protein [Candidatus Calescamantes bacterium]